MLTVHSAFTACGRGRTAGEAAPPRHYGAITLAFGFRGGHDFGQPTVSFRQAGCFFLTLGKKSFERLVQPDSLVDLGAAPGAIGSEPDEVLHIRIVAARVSTGFQGIWIASTRPVRMTVSSSSNAAGS